MPEKFRYAIKRSPRSDPQQYRVYRMENEAIGGRIYARLSRPAIRAFIRGVCKNYHVPQAEVSWADLGRWAAEWRETPSQNTSRIVFNTKKATAADLLTVTHELAHHVHHWLAKGADLKQQDHGPQFMAVHISILDTQRIVPVVGMRAICDAWKIKYADPGTTRSMTKLERICRS